MAFVSPQLASQLMKYYEKNAQANEGLYSPAEPSQEEINKAVVQENEAIQNNQPQQPVPNPLPQQDPWSQVQALLYKNQELMKPYIEAQQRGISDNEETLRQLKARPRQIDFSSLAGLVDNLYGGNLSQSIKPTETEAERLSTIAKLQDLIQKQRGDVTGQVAKGLTDRLSGQLIMAQARQDATQKRFEDKNALLSDKQLESINEFDSTAQEANELLKDLKTGYTGLTEQGKSLPLIKNFSDPDAVAFQSRANRLLDSYRKLVTGAAAADAELKRIESRLPQTSDSPELFREKAADFIKQVNRAKERYIKNLDRKGKNVSNFQSPASQITRGYSKPKQVDQSDWDKATESEKEALANHFK